MQRLGRKSTVCPCLVDGFFDKYLYFKVIFFWLFLRTLAPRVFESRYKPMVFNGFFIFHFRAGNAACRMPLT
jgi:hypothetical protein